MDSPRPEEIKKHAIEFVRYCRQYWYLCIMVGETRTEEEKSKMTEKSLEVLYEEYTEKKPVSL